MKLVRISNGKEEIIETGTYHKLNHRMRTLRKSANHGVVRGWCGRKYRVNYKIVGDDYVETR